MANAPKSYVAKFDVIDDPSFTRGWIWCKRCTNFRENGTNSEAIEVRVRVDSRYDSPLEVVPHNADRIAKPCRCIPFYDPSDDDARIHVHRRNPKYIYALIIFHPKKEVFAVDFQPESGEIRVFDSSNFSLNELEHTLGPDLTIDWDSIDREEPDDGKGWCDSRNGRHHVWNHTFKKLTN